MPRGDPTDSGPLAASGRKSASTPIRAAESRQGQTRGELRLRLSGLVGATRSISLNCLDRLRHAPCRFSDQTDLQPAAVNPFRRALLEKQLQVAWRLVHARRQAARLRARPYRARSAVLPWGYAARDLS